MQEPNWAWAPFTGLLVVMLLVDLWAHRGTRAESRRASVLWTIIWIAAGLGFAVFIWAAFGGAPAQEYLAAYLIEKSLSLDNLFVFLIVFQSLKVPKQYQHNVLFWGIFGALVFRALFIFLGAAALERFEWVSYVFGAILIAAAVHVFRENPAEKRENKAVKFLARYLPVTHEIKGKHLVVREGGRRVATPLLLALVGLELTDIVFAVDSVPAAFSMTRDPFLVYTSNAFAILGLRALYTVLAQTIAELKQLHYGLALVLGFAGAKMIADTWIHVPPMLSVAIIVTIIGASVWVSLRIRARENRGREVPEGARP